MSDYVLVLENVRKVYKTGEVETHALRGVNLAVRRGEFIAIMGPSGSGKTTLLNMIGSLDVPTSGRVLIDGVDISKLKPKEMARLRNQKIGFVFQQFNLISRLTVYENIELPLIPRGLPRKERRVLVERALLRAGGDRSWFPKRPTQLSGGQQQRVAIARAVVTEPPILLADEPTGNLDRASAAKVLSTFLSLNKSGQTIVMVTHDPEVANCAQRILIIRDGVIVKEMAPVFSRCIVNTVDKAT